jgi:hypothetical protein
MNGTESTDSSSPQSVFKRPQVVGLKEKEVKIKREKKKSIVYLLNCL